MGKTRYPGIYSRETRRGLVYDATASYGGKQRQSRGHRTLDEARTWQDGERARMRGGQAGAAPMRLTVREFIDERWLPEALATAGSTETVRSYKRHAGYVVDRLGSIRLQKLSPDDIEAFKRELRRAYGATTGAMAYDRLKQALRYAVFTGLLGANPCDRVRSLKQPKRELLTPSTADIQKVIAVADTTPHGTLVYTAVATGMRWGELASLEWPDVDFAECTLRIPKSKTDSGVRVLALGPETVRRLQEHRLTQLKFMKDHNRPPAKLVFLSEMGQPLNQGNFNNRWWQEIREKAGLPEMRFHDLRHAQATLLARAGVHPRIAQERMGHASSAMTLEVYTHVNAGDQAPAAEAVEGLLLSNS